LGAIRGGMAVNIVPDRCVLEVDRRTLPGETQAAVLQEVRDALDEAQRAGALLSYDVAVTRSTGPSSRRVTGSSCNG